MRASILFLSTFFISFSSFAGTDIIYNTRSSGLPERVVAGNIRFEQVGLVDARNVCFDKVSRVYKTTIPAHTVESCSIKELPVTICAENSGRIIYTEVEAKDLTAPEFVTVKVCTKFDYSDSTHPKCVEYKNVEKQQPLDFTFMKYKVELTYGDYNDPKQYEVRDMKVCE